MGAVCWMVLDLHRVDVEFDSMNEDEQNDAAFEGSTAVLVVHSTFLVAEFGDDGTPLQGLESHSHRIGFTVDPDMTEDDAAALALCAICGDFNPEHLEPGWRRKCLWAVHPDTAEYHGR